MAGRPGQPEGESEIDFNAVEFALSLKTDWEIEVHQKFKVKLIFTQKNLQQQKKY